MKIKEDKLQKNKKTYGKSIKKLLAKKQILQYYYK